MGESQSTDLGETLDRAFRWAFRVPLAERGYKGSGRTLTLHNGDLYYRVQLRGDGRYNGSQWGFSLEGGLAVQSCLTLTPHPARPLGVSQATVVWWSPNYVFEPTPSQTTKPGYLGTVDELMSEMIVQRDCYLVEIDALKTTSDVRERLWTRFSRQETCHERHLCLLLANSGDIGRLEQVLQSGYDQIAWWEEQGNSPEQAETFRIEWRAFSEQMRAQAQRSLVP